MGSQTSDMESGRGHARHLNEADVALTENEQRLSFHMNNSPMAVVEWDADFVVTRWAGDAEKMFGWTAAETIGKAIVNLNMIYDDDIPVVKRTMERLTSGNERTVVSSNRNYTKDGRVIYCVWYNSVLVDARGKMLSVMSQVLDITERTHAEKALRGSEERFRLLADNIPDLIMRFDKDLRLVYVNPAAAQHLGISGEWLTGESECRYSSLPDTAGYWEKVAREVFDVGESRQYEHTDQWEGGFWTFRLSPSEMLKGVCKLCLRLRAT